MRHIAIEEPPTKTSDLIVYCFRCYMVKRASRLHENLDAAQKYFSTVNDHGPFEPIYDTIDWDVLTTDHGVVWPELPRGQIKSHLKLIDGHGQQDTTI
jgi:methenyltetrahydromethanopterin cyclohydrolase